MSEQAYLDLVENILTKGETRTDRTGTGTKSIFGYQMRFSLNEGFPLLTTKKVPFSLIKSELLWFLRGDTNIRYLLEHNNHIWDEWAFQRYIESEDYQGPDMTDFGRRAQQDEAFNRSYRQEKEQFCQKILTDEAFAQRYGELGPVYGKQWCSWKKRDGSTLNQLKNVIEEIKQNPDSRRLIVSAWNPEDVDAMALPPCHVLFQFYVQNGKLSCQLYQRSGDVFLGVPFNIASYALLTHLIAHECQLEVGDFVHILGDAHIYLNHIEQMQEQLKRTPYPFPTLKLNPNKASIFDFMMEDIQLENYQSHPAIKGEVAV